MYKKLAALMIVLMGTNSISKAVSEPNPDYEL